MKTARRLFIIALAAMLGWSASGLAWPAPANDVLLQALADELSRSSRDLQLKGHERPYFIQYTVDDVETYDAVAASGALVYATPSRSRSCAVDVRVGTYAIDSSGGRSWPRRTTLVLDDVYGPLRNALWKATDDAYRGAVQNLAVRKSDRRPSAQRDAADFSKEEPTVILQPRARLEGDLPRWEHLLRGLTAVRRAFPTLQEMQAMVRLRASNHYVLNSEGTRVRSPGSSAMLLCGAEARAEDGTLVQQTLTFAAPTAEGLPAEPALLEAVRGLARDVVGLAKAPAIKEEDYVGPVLFVRQAASDLYEETLFPLCTSDEAARRNRAVLPVSMSVVDDPLQKSFQGQALLGAYDVDDEGVRATPVRVIEKGLFQRSLSGRTPTRMAARSNGHFRGSAGMTGACVSNLFVRSTEGRPLGELKAELLRRCRQEGLPYGYILRAPGGSPMAAVTGVSTLYYRVSVADGRETLVRGVERERFTLRALRRVAAVGDDASLLTLFTDPRSGLAVSLVTPSILLSELEITSRKGRSEEANVIPAP